MCAEDSLPRFDSPIHQPVDPIKYDPPCPLCGKRMYHAGNLVFFRGYTQPVLACLDDGCEGARLVVVNSDHLMSYTDAQAAQRTDAEGGGGDDHA